MDTYAFEINSTIFPPAAFRNLGNLMSVIISGMASVAVILCVIFIIVGGFKFITATGDEKKIASAKSTLTYAILGLIALILTFVILQVVQYFLRSTVPILG